MYKSSNIHKDILLGIILLAASLWDFRQYDIRVFDIIALCSCLMLFLVSYKDISFKTFDKNRLFMVSILILWSLYGFWSYNHYSSFVMIGGVFLLFALFQQQEIFSRLHILVPIVLFVHLIVFWIQYFSFYLFDYYVDYFTYFEGAARNFSMPGGMKHFRPSGLFQEPNSFSLCIFMLTSLCLIQKNKYIPFLIILAGFSMMVSQSLWGSIASIMLFLCYILLTNKINTKYLTRMVLALSGVILLFVGLLFLQNSNLNQTPQFLKRIDTVFSSGSFRERFITNTLSENDKMKWSAYAERDWSQHKNKVKWEQYIKKYTDRIIREEENKKYTDALMSNVIIGHGFSTKPFVYGLALNGFSFFWNSLGLLGISLVLLSSILFTRRASVQIFPELACYFVIFIMLLLSYPIVTYSFFWFWMFSIIVQIRSKQTCTTAKSV